MRDRLIKLLNVHQDYGTKYFYSENSQGIASISNELLADHLLANGVIVPPCKVGDVVYTLVCFKEEDNEWIIIEEKIYGININDESMYFVIASPYDLGLKDLNKTWFVKKEEAEQALKGVVQANV